MVGVGLGRGPRPVAREAADLQGTPTSPGPSRLLIVLYLGWASAQQRFARIKYIHPAAVAMLGSMVWAYFFHLRFQTFMKFNQNAFSYVLLPAIIFAAGFNAKKTNLMVNRTYISAFGVIGTILMFFILASVSFATPTVASLVHPGHDEPAIPVQLTRRSALVGYRRRLCKVSDFEV